MAVELTLGQVPRYLDERQAVWRKAAIRGVQSAGMRGLQDILVRIIPSRTPQPVDRGIYRSGWQFYPTADGCILENIETHALFIEDGVRAEHVKIGRKMINAIAEWAVRKGMVADAEKERVAWAIAKKMQKRGIFAFAHRGRYAGLGILEELVDKYLDKYIDEEVAREIARAGL